MEGGIEPFSGFLKYRETALALGVIQLLLGTFSIIEGADAIMIECSYGYFAYGFWCGFVFIVSGSVSSATGSRPNRDLLVTNAALSFVAFVFSIAELALATLSLVKNLSMSCSGCPTNYTQCTWWHSAVCIDSTQFNQIIFVEGTFLFIALFEFCVSLSLGVITCARIWFAKHRIDPLERHSNVVVPSYVHVEEVSNEDRRFEGSARPAPYSWKETY